MLTDCIDATTPTTGGVGDGVKVSVGVGGTGVTEGVKVWVGIGVLVGTGVAVKRGVLLTMGASVAVGGIGSMPPPIASHAPAASSMKIHIQRFRISFHTLNEQADGVQHSSKRSPAQSAPSLTPFVSGECLNSMRQFTPHRQDGDAIDAGLDAPRARNPSVIQAAVW
jgi:hypothetical protein